MTICSQSELQFGGGEGREGRKKGNKQTQCHFSPRTTSLPLENRAREFSLLTEVISPFALPIPIPILGRRSISSRTRAEGNGIT
jgi:hypothetical protein